MSTSFLKFSINSTLEYSADHFALAFTGSEPFRTKTKTDTVSITIGLLSGTTPLTITFLDAAPVDEFEIVVTPRGITGTKHGRDQAANALDGKFQYRYYRYPRTAPPDVQQFDSFGQPIPIIPFTVGQFYAQQIARAAAAAVGLTLSWGVPDYILQNDFFASGRVIDTINKLVRPFTLVAPFQADVYVIGSTLYVTPRRGPNPAADYTIAMSAMKRDTATFRVRKTQKYGLVTLRGQAASLPTHLVGVQEVPTEFEESSSSTDETFDATGTLISRIITTTTYQQPSGNLLREEKQTYTISPSELGIGLSLSALETTDNFWDTVGIDRANPVAQKKLLSQTHVIQGYDQDINGWLVTQVDYTGYSYDDNAFQTSESTLTKKFDRDTNQLETSQLVTKTMRDIGTLLVEYQTSSYVVDQSQGFDSYTLQNRHTQQQGGVRPGGPGRAQPLLASNAGQSGRSIEVSKLIDTGPYAFDVNEDAGDLTRDQMLAILAQYTAANYIWEYEALFEGVNMPWIQRGQYLKITDIESEIVGTNIELPTMLVLEANASYDESIQGAKSTVQIRCIGWSAT